MSERFWTKEQLEAIEDTTHNLLVSAAAGSGKTSVLVERIIRLVISGKANVDELLVVTFTEAAASEMKAKLYKALDEKGLKDQLERMPNANISSFHSFALSIVKRYYHLIGLKPSLSVCDSIKSGLLKEDAMDDLFSEMFDKKDPDFLAFLDSYENGLGTDATKGMILKLYDFLMSMPNPREWTKSICEKNDALIDEYMRFAAEEVLRLLSLAREYHIAHRLVLLSNNLKKFADAAAEDISFHDTMIAAISANPELGLSIFAGEKKYKVKTLRGSGVEKDILDSIKVYRDNAKNCRDAAYKLAEGLCRNNLELEQSELNKVFKVLTALTWRFDELYKEKKAGESCIDFSDMEHYAMQILEDETAASEYREKFKFIFVDEYQDTNSLQESLIYRLKRENNLFMVGDVKQSIYKFRLAEPELFMSHYREYKENSEKTNKAIDLNANFRSKGGVIDSVNEIFSKLMTMESCGMEYDDAASLKKGISYNGDCSYPCRFEFADIQSESDEDDKISDLKATELSAVHAAAIIKENVGKTVYDTDKAIERPLDYRDMVILLPQLKGVGEVYYKYFTDNNIPVYLERDTGYFDTIEIGVFINLLKIIENQKQDIPLLSVLCCPIFGFCADDLAMARLAAPDLSFSESFFEYAKTDKKAAAFAALLQGFREDSKLLPLADFIYSVLLKTGYMDFESARNAGMQKLANLKALVLRAESFEKSNMTGLSGFISFAEALAKHGMGIDLGQAKTINESMNCVRIMTIHKSKGLEFPFVLVCGMEKALSGKSDSSSFSLHKKFGASIRLVNPKVHSFADTKIAELIKIQKNKENLAERIRLLYVAMTRAKDILILSGLGNMDKIREKLKLFPADNINAKSYLDLICSAASSGNVFVRDKASLSDYLAESEKANDNFEKYLRSLSEKPSSTDEADEYVKDLLNYPYFKKKHTAKRKYSVSQIAEEGREEKYHASDFKVPMFAASDDHGLSANERGTAYHTVMEQIPFTSEGKSLSEISAFIESLKEKNILSAAEASCIDPAKIKAFFDSDIGKRALKAKELHKELHKEASFVLKTKHNKENTLVQGTIDCYFEEDGEYVLLDYKSNYVDKANKQAVYERLKEMYKPQLRLYKEALEKITKKKVKSAVLYLFSGSEELELETGDLAGD